MRKILIASLAGCAFVLGACSTAPEDKGGAKVEERTPGGKPPVTVQTPPVKEVTAERGTGTADPALKQGILARRSIYYDFDKFDVRDEYRGMVEAHAKYLREHPGARMLIQGNTDERGSREYNIGLGQRRSDGVKKMLTLLGVRENQMESVSLGEEKPQDAGHDEAAWAKNRRSDMLYNGEY